jgi:dTDP-4-amino-4,6-dideoxygalactose transaminase
VGTSQRTAIGVIMKKNKVSLVSIKVGKPEQKLVEEVFQSNWVTMGPKTLEFERLFAKYVGAKFAVAVNSCTSALQLSLAEKDLEPGDEVITTPFTWESTTTAILYGGGKPVFADLELNSGNISLDSIKKVKTNKTKGIVLVHYAGWPADISEIKDFAKEEGLFLIEDCAHGLGSKYDGKHVGTFGDNGCFSFGSTKTVTTGEGGMIVTNNEQIDRNLRVLRNYGADEESFNKHLKNDRDYEIQKLSYNFKINEIASAVGIAQMGRLPGYVKGRRNSLGKYRKYFEDCNKAQILYEPSRLDDASSPLFIPLLLRDEYRDKRSKLIEDLKKEGIDTVVQYPVLYNLKFFREYFGDLKGSCPVAEDVSSRILSLPCHPEVTDDDVLRILSVVENL